MLLLLTLLTPNSIRHNQSLHLDALQPSLCFGFRAGEFGVVLHAHSFVTMSTHSSINTSSESLWPGFVYIGPELQNVLFECTSSVILDDNEGE